MQGTVIGWRGSFGWVRATTPLNHPEAAKHSGKIFLHRSDVEGESRIKNGTTVSFFLYSDESGLGAQGCRVVGSSGGGEGGGNEQAKATKGVIKSIDKRRHQSKAPKNKVVQSVYPSVLQSGRKWLGAAKAAARAPVPAVRAVGIPAPKAAPKMAPKVAPKLAAKHGKAAGKAVGKGGAAAAGSKPGNLVKRVVQAPKAAGSAATSGKGATGKGGKAAGSAPASGKGASGKGSKAAPAASSTAGSQASGQSSKPGRRRQPGGRVTGTVSRWMGGFGWIHPDKPINHPAAKDHHGTVFVHKSDLEEGTTLEKGAKVEFFVYSDTSGLGAEGCQLQTAGSAGRFQGTPAPKSASKGNAKGSAKGNAKGNAKGQGASHINKGSAYPVVGRAAPKVTATSRSADGRQGATASTATTAPVGKGNSGKGGGKATGKFAAPGVQKTVSKVMEPRAKQHASANSGKSLLTNSSMPPNWEEHWSDEHEVPYYWNSKTKESRWIKPTK